MKTMKKAMPDRGGELRRRLGPLTEEELAEMIDVAIG